MLRPVSVLESPSEHSVFQHISPSHEEKKARRVRKKLQQNQVLPSKMHILNLSGVI